MNRRNNNPGNGTNRSFKPDISFLFNDADNADAMKLHDDAISIRSLWIVSDGVDEAPTAQDHSNLLRGCVVTFDFKTPKTKIVVATELIHQLPTDQRPQLTAL